VKRKQIGFTGLCLVIGLTTVLMIGMTACGSKKTSTPATSTSTQVSTTTAVNTTTKAAFPYQGTGSGNWSGQITLNSKTYNISGTMTVAVDAGGNFTGTLTSSNGDSVNTTIAAQVDANGNLTGTVGFTISSTAVTTSWQGKITASSHVLTMQGTWTSVYGSGIFSGTGTSTN
jgi:hypothetical protein